MYLAFTRNTSGADGKPASKSTFYAVSRRWRGCLTFRRKTDHAMCVQCASLKSAIQNASDPSSALVVRKSCAFSGGLRGFQVLTTFLSMPAFATCSSRTTRASGRTARSTGPRGCGHRSTATCYASFAILTTRASCRFPTGHGDVAPRGQCTRSLRLRVAWLVDVSVSAVSSLAGVTLTLTCVLAHGHRAYFFFCDEAMSAGSN